MSKIAAVTAVIKTTLWGSQRRRFVTMVSLSVVVSIVHSHLFGKPDGWITDAILKSQIPGIATLLAFLVVVLMGASDIFWKSKHPSVMNRWRERIGGFVASSAMDGAAFLVGMAIVAVCTGSAVDGVWFIFFAVWYAALGVFARCAALGLKGFSTLRAQASIAYMAGITFSPFVSAHLLH